MCGINFIYSKKQPLQKKVIEQMMKATTHRGPDFSTFFHINSNISIAHNRLSVIDLSDQANQPFVLENRYYLSYNGEIYNYLALRKQLENKGVNFTTNSDTEVLAQLLITEGKKGISLLRGMFAFVFFDLQTNCVIAARDAYGIKPLFYTENDEFLIFSSETRGIIASGLVQPSINKEGVNDYLNFKYVTGNATLYNTLFSLNPNEVFSYENNLSLKSFANPEKLNFDVTSIAQLKTTVKEGILASLASDVPLGILLSGGIDSNLIYSTVKQHSSDKLTCFYINIDNDNSEQQQLEKHTKNYNDELVQVDYLANFEQNFHDYIRDLDYPIADSGGFLSWLLTKKAKEKGIKVVLSGAGGDELFCGYNRHVAFHRYLKLMPFIPFNFVKLLPFSLLFSKNNKRLIKKLINDVSANSTETWANFVRLSLPLKNKSTFTEKIDTLDKALLHDQKNYLAEDVLSITDLASMAHGIEVRVPLLFYQLNINADILLKKGRKWALKELSQTPANTKKGFGIYLSDKLLMIPSVANIFTLLKNPNHYIYNYLKYSETQVLIQNHRNKKNDYSPELWSLIILICWLERNSLSAELTRNT